MAGKPYGPAIVLLLWIGAETSAANGFYRGTPVQGYTGSGAVAGPRARLPDTDPLTPPDLDILPDQLAPPRIPLQDTGLQRDEPTEPIGNFRTTPIIRPLTRPLVNVPGMETAANPPDPVGDVGPNHYVQMLNTTLYQVFDKKGLPLTEPRLFGTLWLNQPDTPGNRACRRNHGDPVVVYDPLADRWLMSQFAQAGDWAKSQFKAPFYLCVALSRTPDPVTGEWFLYAFELPHFPDYPKIGVWPDGYYMASVYGNRLYATVFDRTRMLTGDTAGFAQFDLPVLGAPGVRDTRMLPTDLDGTPPLPGTPDYFVRTVDDRQDPARPVDRIELYAFRADFAADLFSFNKVSELTRREGLEPFDIMNCNRAGSPSPNVRDCIPQPGPAGTLDALSNRPMMSLRYRRLARGRELLAFNQTVNVQDGLRLEDGSTPLKEVAGIRWYQLQRWQGQDWRIASQGTYAPQPEAVTDEAGFIHRWMGSMAMDKAGNLALAYSLVNGDERKGYRLFPGIAYTGRRFNDAPDRMTAPQQWISRGTRLQWPRTGASSLGQRWGDYSSLSVDPVDDCTFWYTQHLASGQESYKKTRIASFRFSNCRR